MDNGTGGQPVTVLPGLGGGPVQMPEDPRSMRARIFSAERKRFQHRVISFFGESIEIRQPSLANMTQMNDDTESRVLAVYILLNHTYIPGTDTKVFEDANADELTTMPFSEDFARVNDAFNEMTGFKKATERETKNSKPSLSDSK